VTPRYCYEPWGVTYLNDNEILVADELNHRIQQVDVQTGTVVKSFGKHGKAKGEFPSWLIFAWMNNTALL